MFFRLSSWEVALILLAVVLGTTAIGLVLGRYLRHRSEHLREPFGVLQAALLGLVGLVLAFGLALAVGRYETRRTAVVDEANAIGTTYLPRRDSPRADPHAVARTPHALHGHDHRHLERRSGQRGRARGRDNGRPAAAGALGPCGAGARRGAVASAPRLYVESLNEMFDAETTRIALWTTGARPVLAVEVGGAAVALALLAFYLAILGRGVATVMLAAGLITVLLLVTFDLDRPTRGLIQVPDTPLVNLRASMELPPAASAPEPVASRGTR